MGDGRAVLLGQGGHLDGAISRHGLVRADDSAVDDAHGRAVRVAADHLGQDRVEIDAIKSAGAKGGDDIGRIERDVALVARDRLRVNRHQRILAQNDRGAAGHSA